MLSWDGVKAEFAWEGSWRDICVLETSIDEWQATLDMLRARKFNLAFTINGAVAELPQDIGEAFEKARDAALCLSVFTRGVCLNCHFFDLSEIEFDLDPREILGQLEFDAVVEFMQEVAAATDKFVLMTPENTHDAPFVRVAPSRTTEYISSEGFFEGLARRR